MTSSAAETSPAPSDTDAHKPTAGLWALTLGSVGVVYGDIGTSPLYAFREAVLGASQGGSVTREVVLGILSMILWALILVVAVKYVTILLRADNNGEGGTLSLTALATRALGRRSNVIFVLGVIGGAMFLGDSMITPAISVLSAVEGLKLVTPALGDLVVPIAVVILVCLFVVQSRGTAKVAAFFGPIMVLWFLSIAGLGLLHIQDDPGVLFAINPYYALRFAYDHPFISMIALGAIFLVVTGGEALYADLGHFGRKPIQIAWFALVLPSLIINYFGQGALVLANPAMIENPFYRLAPDMLLLPMVLLATAATVIASQAVITGAFSLVYQAIQLGYVPRLTVVHTSASQVGQIYIPRVNWLLMLGVMLLVVMFRTSGELAGAYGIAVSTAMVMDGLLAFLVIRYIWKWPLWQTSLVLIPLILLDIAFFSANLLKLMDGAWVPMLFGACMLVLVLTWRRGTQLLAEKTRRSEVPLETLVRSLEKSPRPVVPGMAMFLTADPDSAPTALLHNLKHNKVLHEQNVILTVVTRDTPRVPEAERVTLEALSDRFSRMTLTFGYMESSNIPRALGLARKQGFNFDIMSTSFFLSRRALKPSPQSGMPLWQDRLYIALAKSSSDATDFFSIPTGRVVEVGMQVTV